MTTFLDTNVVLYSISDDPAEKAKHDRAIEILREETCAMSVQVLQEFYVQATRPTFSGSISHELAVGFIEKWMRYPVQDMTLPVLMSALDIKARHRLSYRDAAIVAAAQAQGCETLYSEDMAHGMTIGATRIVNPFL